MSLLKKVIEKLITNNKIIKITIILFKNLLELLGLKNSFPVLKAPISEPFPLSKSINTIKKTATKKYKNNKKLNILNSQKFD